MFNSFDYNSGFLKSLEMLKNFKKIVSKEIDKEILLRLHPNFSTPRGVCFKNPLTSYQKIFINLK